MTDSLFGSIYLGGPITGLSVAEAFGWREDATEILTALGYDVRSPLRGKGSLQDEFGDEPLTISTNTTHILKMPYFVRDMYDIDHSGIVIFNFLFMDKPSIGSMVELGHAHGQGKLIILVMPPADEAPAFMAHDGVYHEFLARTASVVVDTMEDAYDVCYHLMPTKGGRVVKVVMSPDNPQLSEMLELDWEELNWDDPEEDDDDV